MKTALSMIVLAAAVVATSQAGQGASNYYAHRLMKGNDARGEFEIDYVQLTPHSGSAMTPGQIKVNQILENEAKEQICDAGTTPDEIKMRYSQMTSKVTFVSDRLISVDENISNYCGGAHPNDELLGELYDLRAGQLIELSTGLPPSDPPAPETLAFRKLVNRAMKANVKAVLAKGVVDASCKDVYNDLDFDYPSISLSPRAVTATTTLPRAVQTCNFATVIPLKAFLKIAKKGSLLEDLVLGAQKIPKTGN